MPMSLAWNFAPCGTESLHGAAAKKSAVVGILAFVQFCEGYYNILHLLSCCCSIYFEGLGAYSYLMFNGLIINHLSQEMCPIKV